MDITGWHDRALGRVTSWRYFPLYDERDPNPLSVDFLIPRPYPSAIVHRVSVMYYRFILRIPVYNTPGTPGEYQKTWAQSQRTEGGSFW
jgi:hypothetical protein